MLLLALPTALIMRRQPEDYGQLPDGRTEGGAGVSAADTEALNLDRLNSYTRSEALRTRAFYLLTLSFAFFGAAAFTLLIHGIPFVTEAGFTRTEAALAVGVAGVGNFAAKILWGWALGRWHPRILWAMCYALLCIGSVLQLVAGGLGLLTLMHVAFFLWGLGFGGGVPLGEFIWAKYFGRVHIGAVRSVGMPAGILFGAAGPLVASLLFDASGSYLAAWVLMIALYCLGAAAVLTSREPPQKVTSAQLRRDGSPCAGARRRGRPGAHRRGSRPRGSVPGGSRPRARDARRCPHARWSQPVGRQPRRRDAARQRGCGANPKRCSITPRRKSKMPCRRGAMTRSLTTPPRGPNGSA